MPHFQLEVVVALLACSLLSAVSIVFSSPDEGKIKLPHFAEDSALQDPFDVTKPEDIVDGEPVDEANFWAKASTTLCCPMNIGRSHPSTDATEKGHYRYSMRRNSRH